MWLLSYDFNILFNVQGVNKCLPCLFHLCFSICFGVISLAIFNYRKILPRKLFLFFYFVCIPKTSEFHDLFLCFQKRSIQCDICFKGKIHCLIFFIGTRVILTPEIIIVFYFSASEIYSFKPPIMC